MFGKRLVLKLFRRIESGPNPDVEIGEYLTRRHFARVPPLVGTISYVPADGSSGIRDPGSGIRDAWVDEIRNLSIHAQGRRAATAIASNIGEVH